MNINLHIERLVLDGLPVTGQQGPLLQAAVEGELTRLLIDGGSIAQLRTDGAAASINGGAIHLAPGADVTTIGKQVAMALHGGLRGWQ